MKRILIVITTQFVPYGGLTTVAMNYYRQIDHKKFKMDFASTNVAQEGLHQELASNGDAYYRLPRRINLVQYYIALKELCHTYDIVHVHANSATATVELKAAEAAGVKKRIIHIHNTTCSHMRLHKALKPVFDRTYTDAIACSKAAGEWIFPENNFLILNNAIDLCRYGFSEKNRQIVRSELGIGDELVIGHVGKMVYQKNHEFLIRVFAKLHVKTPDAKLLLVGDGVLRKDIESQVDHLGLGSEVIFTGMVNAAERYLSAMDVFVFPSRWEGLPLSIMEAQANGLKCIVSEKVTKEVNITGTIPFLNINDENKWITEIINSTYKNRKTMSIDNCLHLRENNYDILTNTQKLVDLYTT